MGDWCVKYDMKFCCVLGIHVHRKNVEKNDPGNPNAHGSGVFDMHVRIKRHLTRHRAWHFTRFYITLLLVLVSTRMFRCTVAVYYTGGLHWMHAQLLSKTDGCTSQSGKIEKLTIVPFLVKSCCRAIWQRLFCLVRLFFNVQSTFVGVCCLAAQ